MSHSSCRLARCGLLAALAAAAPCAAAEPGIQWNFAVQLDGRAIGTHRFELVPAQGALRSLQSEARFEVKFLGITAYRYRHRSAERWNGDCLAAIAASTDDDGAVTVVDGQDTNGRFTVSTRQDRKPSQASSQGCLMAFAYWNPAQLSMQRQLLDQGTGRIEAVTITTAPASSIPVHGQPTAVTGLRITGLKHPIDVWYSNGGNWVGLDTTVEGGRKLTYRLP